ncbi:MAG: DNA adenine methylase [Ktedonobacteraceae bacterium]|nr:DNA adenine methylase [Ktedonobacteraceae bacterium]MBV9711417.1 DNA adenine methylase [Ktedonobacteraceae bacterium]
MQYTLFDNAKPIQIVNVGSVPKRSPFRYPGGKTWIIPHIRLWLSPQIRQKYNLTPVHPFQLIEPFAGGGSVSLTAAAENLVNHVIMVELDEEVASVWQTILDEENWAWLAHEIETFDVIYKNVEFILAKTNLSQREQALKTIIKNRVNRGGILAPGAGLLKEGEKGKGLKSRWYPTTLKKRIQAITKMRDHISFIAGDGMKILKDHAERPDTVFFIDPPYTAAGKKAGKRLYTHSELNHEELFEIASSLRCDFLMTYDDTDEVRALAKAHNFDVQLVPMKNTHHTKMNELCIGRNLEWLRPALQ